MDQKIKKSVPLNLLFIVLLVAVSYGSYKAARQAVELNGESRETKKKVEELTRKKIDLERQLVELKTREEIERTGKESLNLKNQGENVVVVVPDSSASSTPSEQGSWLDMVKELLRIGK